MFIKETITNNKKTNIIPFITCGFPKRKNFVDLLFALEKSGSSIIEIGIPNSDPLAEGLTIQYSSNIAIKNGINTQECIKTVRIARKKGLKIPIVLMGYYNNILSYDMNKFCKEAKESGVNGLIVADLPVNESKPLVNILNQYSIDFIPLLSINSSKEIIRKATELATGFIYCVSVLGVTGERNIVFDRVQNLVEKVKKHTNVPVAVGFGISTKNDINKIIQFADAAVVGSALINKLKDTKNDKIIEVASNFISELF